jgi:hypothetical protein
MKTLPFPPMPISHFPPLNFSEMELIAFKNIIFVRLDEGVLMNKFKYNLPKSPPQG